MLNTIVAQNTQPIEEAKRLMATIVKDILPTMPKAIAAKHLNDIEAARADMGAQEEVLFLRAWVNFSHLEG